MIILFEEINENWLLQKNVVSIRQEEFRIIPEMYKPIENVLGATIELWA